MKTLWLTNLTATLALSLALSLTAQAKLSDFNQLIEENSKAQSELHTSLKNNLQETQVAINLEKRDRFVVDSADSINVPTRKSFLTYTKSKIDYRKSAADGQKRLAEEIDQAN